MSHTVHPYAHRLGIIRDWKSRWFSTGKQYREQLIADLKIRAFVEKTMRGMFVSSVEIERGQKALRIIIKTARPGMVIGRNGEGSVKLRSQIEGFMKREGIIMPKGHEVRIDIE
jgi:small subunit ribosomal protein S3